MDIISLNSTPHTYIVNHDLYEQNKIISTNENANKYPMQGPGWLEQNCHENQFFWVSNFTYNHSLKTKRKERNILSKTKFRAY